MDNPSEETQVKQMMDRYMNLDDKQLQSMYNEFNKIQQNKMKYRSRR